MTPILKAALGCVLVALTFAACSSPASDAGSDSSIGRGDPIPASDADLEGASMSHVHGIGRNPADGDVYAATHHGLWRVREGEEPELVGEHLHDFMGFSVVGPDHFIASGHPNSANSLPPHLGLIESKDAGFTWTSRSLLGKADFHALRAAGGTTYGWNSQDGALMVSDDNRTWDTLIEGVMMLDVAADPEEGETVVASVATDRSTVELQRSTDSGRTFEPVDDAPQLARFTWPELEQAFGFAADGTVWRSEDQGESWVRVGTVKAPPEAVAGTADELLAAAGRALLSSTDGGRTWDEIARYQ